MTMQDKFPAVPDHAETLEILHGSALVQEAKREKAKRVAAEREIAHQAMQNGEKELLKEAPKLDAELERSFKAVQNAEKALLAAKRAHGMTFHKNLQRKMELGRVVDNARAELLKTYDPNIDLFRSEMLDQLAATRKMNRVSEKIEKHPVTGAITRSLEGNSASVKARLAAISEAMEAAEAMKLDPDQSRVPERLEALRQGLPAVK